MQPRPRVIFKGRGRGEPQRPDVCSPQRSHHAAGEVRWLHQAPLEAHVETLAETLAAAGYRTVAHAGGGYVGPAYGLDRGFEEWIDRHGATLESVLPESLAALSEIDEEPIFLFLHTYGVHAPYAHPDRHPSFEVPRSGAGGDSWRRLGEMELHRHFQLERFDGIEGLIATYDSSIRFVDSQLGVLFEFMQRNRLLDDTVVILTSDHGESFLERGRYISHGYTFFDEEVRIPLIVRMPGGEPAGRSNELVDSTDIGALVLEVAGIASPPPVSGRSPIARLERRAPSRQFVRGGSAYTGGLYGRTREWKVMTEVDFNGPLGLRRPGLLLPDFAPQEQIYHVEQDLGEDRNLTSQPSRLPELSLIHI